MHNSRMTQTTLCYPFVRAGRIQLLPHCPLSRNQERNTLQVHRVGKCGSMQTSAFLCIIFHQRSIPSSLLYNLTLGNNATLYWITRRVFTVEARTWHRSYYTDRSGLGQRLLSLGDASWNAEATVNSFCVCFFLSFSVNSCYVLLCGDYLQPW